MLTNSAEVTRKPGLVSFLKAFVYWRKKIILSGILTISFVTNVYADIETDYPEITNTILELGLDLEDFSTIWPLYCNTEWSKVVTEELAKEIKFTREAIENKFFAAEKEGKKIKLTAGETCQALHAYYFNNKNPGIISAFVEKDRSIREKYGFSSIDLFKYPGNYQGNITTYKQPRGQKELMQKLVERFKKENVFIVEERIKTTGYDLVDGRVIEINVAPYPVYHLSPTMEFKAAHERLKRGNPQQQQEATIGN